MDYECKYCNQQHSCSNQIGFPNCQDIDQFDNTTKKFKKEYLKGTSGISQLTGEELKEACVKDYISKKQNEMFYRGKHHVSILKNYTKCLIENNKIKINVPIEYNVKLYKQIDPYYGKDKTKLWDFQYLPKINMVADLLLDGEYIKGVRLYDSSMERSFGFCKLDRTETFPLTVVKIIEILNKFKMK